jgi:hypothetical protein
VLNGDGTPAKPLAMMCEASGCNKRATTDCKRKPSGSDWDSEPEALCEEHSQGREVLRRFAAGENPGCGWDGK